MPNSAVALQMFSTVGSLLPPFMFLPLSCSVVFYGCAPSNITPMPHYHSSSGAQQSLIIVLDTVTFLGSARNHPSLYFKEPPEAPFLMFSPSRGRLVGTVTRAGNKEVTVLIGSYYLA
ncbi:hypothetical protein WG66_003877 [Moniliophthora roreri]|nr:hypothetical protein WG66_003877 [Moniliophthora roreri]